MKPSPIILILFVVSACASTALNPTPYPTYTPYPTSTPYPTFTPIPPDEAFINALYDRIDRDDTIPESGKLAIASLYYEKPSFAFRDNQGVVLQFNILSVPDEPELRKSATLLMGTSVIVAGEHGVSLSGIEVVFYVKENDPWLALALAPPWDIANDLRLAPLHPDFIKRLQEAGVITPTPEPTY
jgi:hypothetical protein